MPESLVFRVVLQRTGIVGSGLFEAILVDAAESAQFVAIGDVGIALNGACAVAFSPGEIVKVELGHPSEEPPFVEIRFGRDGLVEILDAEHIILIIERRPSDGYQTVSVELRHHR